MEPAQINMVILLKWSPKTQDTTKSFGRACRRSSLATPRTHCRDELRDRARCSRRQELLANLHGKLTAFQSFALGGIAGSIAEMITMPAVVVRTRLMVQGASATDDTQYRGFFDACQTMLRSEGIGTFYKGDGLFERRHLARGVGQGGRRTISERSFTRSD